MDDHGTLPNFFIIGAPKCGTTSLARWLSGHPQVYMSPLKEPHYFNHDLDHRNIPEEDEYLSLFDEASDVHRAVGEASTHYLFSQVAVPEIESTVTDARYIVMVRNPIEMAHSLHEQRYFAGTEHIEDFETAWWKSERRLQGKDVTFWCREPKLLAYKEICKLGEQLERLYDTVPEERVHVIVLDDLEENAPREYRETVQFLGLEDDGRTEFPVHNTAKERRSRWVQFAAKTIARIKESLGVYRLGINLMGRVNKVNTRHRPRSSLPPRIHWELANYFEDDVHRLSKLLDRDLTHWLEG